jgi:hypothetical protein
MRRLLVVLLALLAVSVTAPPAFADGDPASDILTMQNVFYPYMPKVSPPVREQLTALADAVRARGVPVKLALIASTLDLGAQGVRFDHPASYAELLGLEIEITGRHELTVDVMPDGVGVYRYNDAHLAPFRAAIADIRPTDGHDSDALARAGGRALIAIARVAGHPVPAAMAQPFESGLGSGAGGGGKSPVLWIVAGTLLVAALGAAFRLRQRAPRVAGGNA